jgi:hypothetical protein
MLEIGEMIEKLQYELDELQAREDQASHQKNELDWILNELDNIKSYDPLTEWTEFKASVFSRLVISGEFMNDGLIRYKLSVGIPWLVSGNDLAVWQVRRMKKLNSI